MTTNCDKEMKEDQRLLQEHVSEVHNLGVREGFYKKMMQNIYRNYSDRCEGVCVHLCMSVCDMKCSSQKELLMGFSFYHFIFASENFIICQH